MKIHGIILSLFSAVALFAHGGTKVISNGQTLVFMGDSITQYGKDSEAGYLPLVAKGLAANGVSVTWYGVGIAGNTAADMDGRFSKDALSKNPDVVTILAGVNDCSQGWPNNTSSTPNNVESMVQKAIAAGAKPVVFSPTGSSLESFPKSVDDYSAAVQNIATKYGIPYGTTHEAFKAYVQDPVNPVIGYTDKGFGCKATCDSLHMDVPGNRIIAIEMLKALGFDSETELANAAAAWNEIDPFYTAKLSVKVTAAEYLNIRVAAAKAGKSISEYQEVLFHRGLAIIGEHPAEVAETSGADIELSKAPQIGFVDYDTAMNACRTLRASETEIRSEVGSLPRVLNSAFLAAIHELPSATEADLPKEPVVQVNTSAFSKSIKLNCSGYTGSSTLTDFPVAVRLSSGTPTGFKYSDMANSANGSELRFADATGRSLSYEIEQWNPNGTSLVWVKLPSMNRATTFTMYYGGTPSDTVEAHWTWSADYVGVWHMSEDGGTLADASGNGLSAEPFSRYSACQTAGTGPFGTARVNSVPSVNAFTGQSLLTVEDSALLDLGSDFTFSGWINMTGTPKGDVGRIASRNYYLPGATYKPDWELMVSDYTTLKVFAGSATPVTGTIPSAENNWVHIVGVFNGTTVTVYANGKKIMQQTIAAVADTNNKLVFGSNDKDCSSGHFVGLFDEFRLRDAVMTPDWAKAEYDQAGTTFLGVGDAPADAGDPVHVHNWDIPTYDWSADHSTCTGTAVCLDDSAHTTSKTVTSSSKVVKVATTLATGTRRYTAVFDEDPFSTQTYDEEIPKTEATDPEGDAPDAPPEMNPPAVDPTGATAASGDTTGAKDTKAIQALLDAAASSRGTVKLGEGVFYINAELNVHDGETLTGLGMDKTVIVQKGNARVIQVNGGSTVKMLTVTGGKNSTQWTHGGGIDVEDGTVSWCCATNNTIYYDAKGGSGAGVYLKCGRIDHSIVAYNVSESSGKGAGIGVTSQEGDVLIDTCLVRGNVMRYSWGDNKGGGIGVEYVGAYDKTVTIRNCTIVENSAGANGQKSSGGAIYLGSDSQKKGRVYNCIVFGNSTLGKEGDVSLSYADASDYLVVDKEADLIGEHSLVDNPMFANAAVGNFTLASNSSARGAGMTYSGIGLDLTGADFANPPSIGCYEYTGSTPSVPHTHVWGAPTYTWSKDNATCTASATCTGNSSHKTNVTVTAQYAVVTPATETTDGTGRYTAVFTGIFEPQTKDVTIPKTGSGGEEDPVVNPSGAIAASGDTTGETDASAIQSAIDAASANGTVTLGSGVYYLNAQLVVGNGVTLAGQGREKTVLKAASGKSIVCVKVTGGAKLERVAVTGGKQTTAWAHGAGVYLEDGTVSWCCISNNTISAGNSYGAGVFVKKGTIDHSIIADNSLSGSGYGAGIGAYSTTGAITIDTCLICGNRSSGYVKGGGGIGMYVGYQKHDVKVVNTTIAGNVADNTGDKASGGAIHLDGNSQNTLVMTNCIVAGNSSKGCDGDIYLEYDKRQIDYSLFDKSADKSGDHSAVASAPFVGNGDYHLSAAKELGYTDSTGTCVDLDNCPRSGSLNVGCYEFGGEPLPPPADPIALGEVTIAPSTNYNGSVVTFAFTGDVPDGAAVSAKVTVGGKDYAGTVDTENGLATVVIPADAVTAGNVYNGKIVFTVGAESYTKDITLTQGTAKVVEDKGWIKESASAFNSTGVWSGDKAVAQSGRISVSNAVFTAAKPALGSSVVTVESVFVFGDSADTGFETASRAGVMVVKVGGINRYAFKTATGAVTNTTVTAKTDTAVAVKATLDTAANTVSYVIDNVSFGTYAMTVKADAVSTVRYIGATEVTSLDGAYRFEGLDANLAEADGVEYATVEDAVAAGAGEVRLLWDATWEPTSAAGCKIDRNGHGFAIGGELAYLVKDNGDGTITVTVEGGEDPSEGLEPAKVSFVNGKIVIDVKGAAANCWYALERTDDLTKPFAVDASTWTKGSDLISGAKELEATLDPKLLQGFYRVIVSETAP